MLENKLNSDVKGHVVQTLYMQATCMIETKARMTSTTISERVEDEPYDAAGSHTHTHTHTHTH